MTVARLRRELSSRELAEWQAYDQVVREERLREELARRAQSGASARIQRPRRR